MNTTHGLNFQRTPARRKDADLARSARVPQFFGPNANLILLGSGDTAFGKSLRDAAGQMELLFAQSKAVSGIVCQLRALRPEAVLLDLDLPSDAAWQTADRLLALEDCPSLILVTARSNQYDVETALHAGTLVDKSVGPACLLQMASQTSSQSGTCQVERNLIQRLYIPRLRPCGWSIPVTPAYRFWDPHR